MQPIKKLHKIEITLAKLYGNLPDVISNNDKNNDLLSTFETSCEFYNCYYNLIFYLDIYFI